MTTTPAIKQQRDASTFHLPNLLFNRLCIISHRNFLFSSATSTKLSPTMEKFFKEVYSPKKLKKDSDTTVENTNDGEESADMKAFKEEAKTLSTKGEPPPLYNDGKAHATLWSCGSLFYSNYVFILNRTHAENSASC